jgi:hypothetical protein
MQLSHLRLFSLSESQIVLVLIMSRLNYKVFEPKLINKQTSSLYAFKIVQSLYHINIL